MPAVVGRIARLVAVTALLVSLNAAKALEGDAVRGKRVFQRCYACHSVDPNETTKLQGPSLYRVVGRRAASLEEFEYSPGLRAKREAGLVWSEETLERFLVSPEHVVPGVAMGFFGLVDAEERADLIAYLKASAR